MDGTWRIGGGGGWNSVLIGYRMGRGLGRGGRRSALIIVARLEV